MTPKKLSMTSNSAEHPCSKRWSNTLENTWSLANSANQSFCIQATSVTFCRENCWPWQWKSPYFCGKTMVNHPFTYPEGLQPSSRCEASPCSFGRGNRAVNLQNRWHARPEAAWHGMAMAWHHQPGATWPTMETARESHDGRSVLIIRPKFTLAGDISQIGVVYDLTDLTLQPLGSKERSQQWHCQWTPISGAVLWSSCDWHCRVSPLMEPQALDASTCRDLGLKCGAGGKLIWAKGDAENNQACGICWYWYMLMPHFWPMPPQHEGGRYSVANTKGPSEKILTLFHVQARLWLIQLTLDPNL